MALQQTSYRGCLLGMAVGDAMGYTVDNRSLTEIQEDYLRRGIQDASCVGPGKSNLPFELRRKAGDCSRVTAGPIDLI